MLVVDSHCCGPWWLFSWGQGVLYHHEDFMTPTFTPSLIHHHVLKLSIHIAPVNQLLVSAIPLSLQCRCPSPSPPPSSTITFVAEGLAIGFLVLRNFLCVREPPDFGNGGNRTRDCCMAAWRANTLATPNQKLKANSKEGLLI